MEGLYGSEAAFSSEPPSFIWQLDWTLTFGGVSVTVWGHVSFPGKNRCHSPMQSDTEVRSRCKPHLHSVDLSSILQVDINLHWAEGMRCFFKGWDSPTVLTSAIISSTWWIWNSSQTTRLPTWCWRTSEAPQQHINPSSLCRSLLFLHIVNVIVVASLHNGRRFDSRPMPRGVCMSSSCVLGSLRVLSPSSHNQRVCQQQQRRRRTCVGNTWHLFPRAQPTHEAPF